MGNDVRLSITVSEKTKKRLREEADRMDISMSAMCEVAIHTYLGRHWWQRQLREMVRWYMEEAGRDRVPY